MKYRTIIIDDEEMIRDLLKLATEARGHEVVTFSSPPLCSTAQNDTCHKEHACCEFIISDHMMPGMTGLEFFAFLKRRKCKIPNRALVTALDEDAIRTEAGKLMCHFIPKPFSLSQLVSWLAKCEAGLSEGRELESMEDMKVSVAG